MSMLSVVMLNVVMLGVLMLNVVAPFNDQMYSLVLQAGSEGSKSFTQLDTQPYHQLLDCYGNGYTCKKLKLQGQKVLLNRAKNVVKRKNNFDKIKPRVSFKRWYVKYYL
jgi:hypothetical protein